MRFVHIILVKTFDVLQDVEAETLESTLTNDGYLVVSGRVKGAPEDSGRTLEIKRQEDTSGDKETAETKDKEDK